MKVHETLAEALAGALAPPMDIGRLRELAPELDLAEGMEQGPFHHLDVLDHTLEVIRGVDREIEEPVLGTRVGPEQAGDLRVVALLHDIAKPVTRGEVDGRVLFVAHDSLGAALAHRICQRLGLSAPLTDLAATITALHLKIGFMASPHSDYPPERLIRTIGPFGEELAVLSWSDRLAARGPRLKEEHIERHRELCLEFLAAYREQASPEEPDYRRLSETWKLSPADAGYAASRLRLLRSRGLDQEGAMEYLGEVLRLEDDVEVASRESRS